MTCTITQTEYTLYKIEIGVNGNHENKAEVNLNEPDSFWMRRARLRDWVRRAKLDCSESI